MSLIFTSMGMFIIDEINYPPSHNVPTQKDVIGGGGTYATLGSRIISTSKNSSKTGFIVDKGSDFPKDVETYLKNWGINTVWREDLGRLTTRGWNLYGDRDFRDFKYLTPKKRIVVEDLIENKKLLGSQSFHLICSPERCLEIIEKLNAERSLNQLDREEIIVWEPVPDLCTPQYLKSCLSTLPHLNVLTPNSEEAARFFGLEEPTELKDLESLASRYIPYLTKNSKFNTGSGIVLRCGALGSYTLTSTGFGAWFPAYQNELNPNRKVIDPTGGGNTFIGSFTTGFVLSEGDWATASVCGNIGAGVSIEQIGMPVLDSAGDLWNGKSVKDRIHDYIEWNGLGDELERTVFGALNL